MVKVCYCGNCSDYSLREVNCCNASCKLCSLGRVNYVLQTEEEVAARIKDSMILQVATEEKLRANILQSCKESILETLMGIKISKDNIEEIRTALRMADKIGEIK